MYPQNCTHMALEVMTLSPNALILLTSHEYCLPISLFSSSCTFSLSLGTPIITYNSEISERIGSKITLSRKNQCDLDHEIIYSLEHNVHLAEIAMVVFDTHKIKKTN